MIHEWDLADHENEKRRCCAMKRLSILLLSLLLCLGLCSCAKKKEQKDDIYIFFTSDVHCAVDQNVGFSSLKALVDETKEEHDYVSLVDCGDFIQGGTLGVLSKGSLIVSLMNDLGYDVVTYGNHEFDYGMEVLDQLQEEMEFATVASNVIYSGSKENIFDDVETYRIIDYDGTKVAFIGILTPRTTTSSTPRFFMEGEDFVYDFYSGQDGELLAERIQEVVDEARKQGADRVVALSHLGTFDPAYNCISLISRTEGIDVFLDGHAHSVIVEDRYPNKNGEDVIVSSVGTKLEAVGELIIGKDGTLTTLHVSGYEGKDEMMQKKVEDAYAQLDSILSLQIVKCGHPMLISDEEGIRMVRSRETVMADYVADAIRYEMGADIALMNGGGVRASIDTDIITYQDLLNVTPFSNELVSCWASGQTIVDALEFGAARTERLYKLDGNSVGEAGAFLHVSGLRYTIDTSIPTPLVKDDNGMFLRFDGERRVKDVMVLQNGEYVPIDPDKEYLVASIDYVISNSGDGNTMFKDCRKEVENGPLDLEAMVDYAKYLGDLTDKYLDTEGRIIVE